VVSLHIQRDEDTGAPKGFGFCEFVDVQCAETAIRFFNNYEMNGRLLTVDHAHGNLDKSSAGPSIARLAERGQVAHAEASKQAGGGAAGGMGEVSSQVNNMTARQMYELIGQLKGRVQNQEQAKTLMTQNHLLCCEFLRMQERLGMLTGINLPEPPARAPAPNPAPAALPPVEAAPYYNPAPQGAGWNVPAVQNPNMMNPPMDRAGERQPLQQHAPYDAYAHGPPGAGGMAGPGGGAPMAPAPAAPYMHNQQACSNVLSLPARAACQGVCARFAWGWGCLCRCCLQYVACPQCLSGNPSPARMLASIVRLHACVFAYARGHGCREAPACMLRAGYVHAHVCRVCVRACRHTPDNPGRAGRRTQHVDAAAHAAAHATHAGTAPVPPAAGSAARTSPAAALPTTVPAEPTSAPPRTPPAAAAAI
jgi:hypothetical protein